MAETPADPALPRQARRGLKLIDIIMAVVIVAVIVFLSVILIGKLRLKHEVSTARVVADRVLHDIISANAKDARSLGDQKFQADHSTAELQDLFKNASTYAKGSPDLERQLVNNGSAGQTVTFVYHYGSSKPYYFQIKVDKPAHANSWQLTGISGGNTVTGLDAR